MAKPELGTKRICVSCGARFYDLGKVPAVCPRCGTEQPADQPRVRRPAPLPEDKRKKVAAEADQDSETAGVEDLDDDEDAGDDASVIEDASDLEGGADELAGDIEVEKDDHDSER